MKMEFDLIWILKNQQIIYKELVIGISKEKTEKILKKFNVNFSYTDAEGETEFGYFRFWDNKNKVIFELHIFWNKLNFIKFEPQRWLLLDGKRKKNKIDVGGVVKIIEGLGLEWEFYQYLCKDNRIVILCKYIEIEIVYGKEYPYISRIDYSKKKS